MVEVNKELRQQLDVATENSDKLLKDVNRLGDNWEKLNRELLEKEKVFHSVLFINAYGGVYGFKPTPCFLSFSIGVEN